MIEENFAHLRDVAQRLRRISVLSTSEAGSGHPTTCLSAAEIMSVLFFEEMRFDPKDPASNDADHFVLSKGHAAPILWAALSEAGAIAEDPMTLRKFTSPLEGHPTPLSPWVRFATGSLGQGLSAAVGMAVAKKRKSHPSRVYCLLGDGECAEGSVWEAAMAAGKMALSNLCAVVDVNGLGQSGPAIHEHDVEAVAAPFRAMGWHSILVNGHDVGALVLAFEEARRTTDAPTVLVAHTQKGKGVSAIEGKGGWHGKPIPKGPELDAALAQIGDPGKQAPVSARPYGHPWSIGAPSGPPAPPAYEKGQPVATREAYGTALVKLGKVDPSVFVLDADTKNSTFSEKFLVAFPDRFVESFIAEQNMVGMAFGLQAMGMTPFASSFACFLTRAYDFIRMGVVSRPRRLILCGSHAGVSIGEDGPSQMALEDLAMMRALVEATVFYPSDGVSAERLVALAAATPGITYIRTSRPKTPVLYANDETFVRGGSKVVRSSGKDAATIVGAGVTLHEGMAAADALAKEDVAVRVIDAYSIEPLDAPTLQKAARETGLIVSVEDHSVRGGLGDAVRAAVGDLAPVRVLGVTKIPRSGKPEELLDDQGISAVGIARAVREALR
jgi:transketolase